MLGHIDGSEIDTTFTDKAGNPATLDEEGNTTSVASSGKLVDLCSQLAA